MFGTVCKKMQFFGQPARYHFSQGATFLRMVENYFDKAALHTGIRLDKLNFYKKAESVLKCSIPIVRGTSFII